jgi:S-DNA-T family DNA segregation ATPase FtsK/SpoIIIE
MIMRLALTVQSPGAQRTEDVVLEADPATPVAHIATELVRLMGCDWTAQGSPSINAGSRPGARVLQLPGLRSHGSLAMASPDPGESWAVPLYIGGQRVPPQLTLLESPIRDGVVLGLGGPDGRVTAEPGGLVEIRVVSGPGAGCIYWLQAGYADIGSGPVEVSLWDKAVAPSALRVFVDGRGCCQVAPFEGVEAALDRDPLAAAAQWQPGQLISVGRSLIGLAHYRPPDAALHPSAAAAAAAGTRCPVPAARPAVCG